MKAKKITANLDKGTSVWFSSGYMQVICREGEHEFIDVEMSTAPMDRETDVIQKFRQCKYCGEIEKQPDNWEDIWEVFKKSDIFSMRGNFFYLELLIWLKENYNPPTKTKL